MLSFIIFFITIINLFIHIIQISLFKVVGTLKYLFQNNKIINFESNI